MFYSEEEDSNPNLRLSSRDFYAEPDEVFRGVTLASCPEHLRFEGEQLVKDFGGFSSAGMDATTDGFPPDERKYTFGHEYWLTAWKGKQEQAFKNWEQQQGRYEFGTFKRWKQQAGFDSGKFHAIAIKGGPQCDREREILRGIAERNEKYEVVELEDVAGLDAWLQEHRKKEEDMFNKFKAWRARAQEVQSLALKSSGTNLSRPQMTVMHRMLVSTALFLCQMPSVEPPLNAKFDAVPRPGVVLASCPEHLLDRAAKIVHNYGGSCSAGQRSDTFHTLVLNKTTHSLGKSLASVHKRSLAYWKGKTIQAFTDLRSVGVSKVDAYAIKDGHQSKLEIAELHKMASVYGFLNVVEVRNLDELEVHLAAGPVAMPKTHDLPKRPRAIVTESLGEHGARLHPAVSCI